MTNPHILIAGGGIAGLSLALTLHQVGVRCTVYESVPELRPLGVGINLQPNAVRELFDMGFTADELDRVGVPAREWALVGRNGNDIYAEPRGLLAGYNWPQYAVHRGQLQMLLYGKVVERLGPDAVQMGLRVTGYEQGADGVTAVLADAEGRESHATGTLLIGADGLHSAIRAQMHPDQPPIQWGGAILWRGVTRAKPIRTGSSFVGLGTHKHRMVIYPISHTDADGMATINWIAEQTFDNSAGWEGDWNKKVSAEDFVHHFEGWNFDWLDVPALIRGAAEVYEYPMIDREPVPTWVDGRVALMGDAAHVMYPTGSNGASQAIIDARVIGSELVAHGVNAQALAAYDARLCGPVSELILRNRGAGPFGMLNIVDDRCGGEFDDIDDVFPEAERAEFMAGYKKAAGFAIEALNAAPPTIAPGAQVPV
ncbi:flavin-dependent oxidoreductase [Lutimaribacter saemankumensis]|uniref:2-polyprenyl-6-methoxyphenol hydroxylase n=1 Tax=Lutimaribacter saemankumensis TaxID=490829 RepID=A0A1G8N2U3_9RHOB|nr:flavin-dependent oxidoreductase [Lutimaribacter saemankumensis]SDI74514.1 2-polyprenyl-6-methoxyphenol hydroxylase [Lutimaribacter saemankumensis]